MNHLQEGLDNFDAQDGKGQCAFSSLARLVMAFLFLTTIAVAVIRSVAGQAVGV